MRELEPILQRIEQRLDNIEVILAKQQISLDDHIRRTEILEEAIKPVIAHVSQVQGVGRFLTLLSILGAIATAIIAVLKYS